MSIIGLPIFYKRFAPNHRNFVEVICNVKLQSLGYRAELFA